MKKMIFASAFVLFALLSCDDNNHSASDVPQSAKSALETKYPGATDVEWESETKDGKKIYEAKFNWSGKKIEAEFAADGSFIGED